MRVAVLGGGRFIGPAIIEELEGSGHEVVMVHRGRHAAPELGVRRVICDRRDGAALRGALAELGPDVVVDTCAYARADAVGLVEAVPAGTHLVVLSSMDVYRAFSAVRARGPATDPLPLDETSAVRPDRYPYRGSPPPADFDGDVDHYDKLDVEEALPGALRLRLPMVYGERDGKRREELVLRRVRAGRRRIPIGAGTFLWTRAWVRDVARAVRLAAEHRDLAGLILNIGEGHTGTIEQWMRAILAAAGSDAELVRVADDAVPDDLSLTRSFAQHLLVSSARARDLLGFRDTPPDEALGHSVRWHLAHPPPDSSPDFSADDQALALGRQAGDGRP